MSATFVVPWDGFRYTPSEEDKLVLATAIYGETRGEHSEKEWARMLWTWTNRFMLKVNRPWPTLANLVLNHSQPVNPKWRSNGLFCSPGGKYYGKPNCSPARLAWRSKMDTIIASSNWGAIPAGIRKVTQDFVDGKIQEPRTNDGSPMVDFAVTVGAKKHGTQYEPGGNYFLSYQQVQGTGYMASFIKDHVIVEGGAIGVGGSVPSELPPGVKALLALPLGYLLFKVGELVYEKLIRRK